MVNRIRRWLRAGIGYLLYVTGVLVLFLWLLFPQETVRRAVEGELGQMWPASSWRVGALTFALPANLILHDVEGYDRGEQGRKLVGIDRLTLSVQPIASLRLRRLQAGCRIEMDKGTVDGFLSKSLSKNDVQVQGAFQAINITQLSFWQQALGREVQGVASGSFSVAVQDGTLSSLDVDLEVKNGRIGLKRPVLNHSTLPFTAITATLHGRGGALQIEHGLVKSELFDGRFSGMIRAHSPLLLSELDIEGEMDPQSDFFVGVENTLAFEALHLQLKDKALPFKISGTLLDPGLHFQEYAVLFQKLEQELH
ncbi:MAG: type II secretion system protein GspN [Desulfobulbus oligotrophicus]|nr:type II secretion system protein GspN [Desulfobulbus oligotrophicus]